METIQWQVRVPFYRNRFILRGFMLALGIPLLILALFLTMAYLGHIAAADIRYGLGLIGILFALIMLLTLALYGGRYAPGYIIDDVGIVNYTKMKRPPENRTLNTIVSVFNLVRGNISSAGGVQTPRHRQLTRIRWEYVSRVCFYPRQHTILVLGEYTEKIAIFCTRANYAAVEDAVRARVPAGQTGG